MRIGINLNFIAFSIIIGFKLNNLISYKAVNSDLYSIKYNKSVIRNDYIAKQVVRQLQRLKLNNKIVQYISV